MLLALCATAAASDAPAPDAPAPDAPAPDAPAPDPRAVAVALAAGMPDYNRMMTLLRDASAHVSAARASGARAPLRQAQPALGEAAAIATRVEATWNAAARLPGIPPELQNVAIGLLGCPFGIKHSARALAAGLAAVPADEGTDAARFLTPLEPTFKELDESVTACRTRLDTFAEDMRARGVDIGR